MKKLSRRFTNTPICHLLESTRSRSKMTLSPNPKLALFSTVVLCFLVNLSLAQDAKQEAKSPASVPDAAVVVDSKVEAKREEPKQVVADKAASPATSPAIKIGGGDLLEMKVFGVPEMTEEVRVSADGNISISLIGIVHVDGLTSSEAEKVIETKLVEGGYLREPHVSVFVKEYVTQGISVMGEVQRPGIYPLLGARRLFDALSSAGGTTPRAGRIVSITRRDKQEPLLVDMNNDPAKAAVANVEIFPGDTVVVSKAGVVYVVGDVVRPSGFVMENNESLTVLQAVALAQGLNHTAALNNSKLIRKTTQGLKEIPVPLKQILEGKNADIAMQGEDILFIPTSAAKGAFKRSLEAAVQMATGVAVYRR